MTITNCFTVCEKTTHAPLFKLTMLKVIGDGSIVCVTHDFVTKKSQKFYGKVCQDKTPMLKVLANQQLFCVGGVDVPSDMRFADWSALTNRQSGNALGQYNKGKLHLFDDLESLEKLLTNKSIKDSC